MDATGSHARKRANLGVTYQYGVMLDCILRPRRNGHRLADPACACTSYGDQITVAFMPAEHPMTSYFIFDLVPSKRRPASSSYSSMPPPWLMDARVVAAHRSCILLRFLTRTGKRGVNEDFFLSRAGTLRKLPDCGHDLINLGSRKNIGIVCPEDGEVGVVAHFNILPNMTARLCILGKNGLWRTTDCVPILHAKGEDLEDLVWWESDAVIPFGNFICWVDYLRGMLLCDVFSPCPQLKYVPLPVNSYQGRKHRELGIRGPLSSYRSVCVNSNGDTIKFIDVAPTSAWFYGQQEFPRCYPAIATWTLSADMIWMKDGMMTENEFHALAKQCDLPSSVLKCPLVDINNPHCIYIALGEESPSCLVSLNMMRKTLSVIPCEIRSSRSSDDIYRNTISCNVYHSEPFIPCEYWDYATNTRNRGHRGKTSFGA